MRGFRWRKQQRRGCRPAPHDGESTAFAKDAGPVRKHPIEMADHAMLDSYVVGTTGLLVLVTHGRPSPNPLPQGEGEEFQFSLVGATSLLKAASRPLGAMAHRAVLQSEHAGTVQRLQR
jgi:hypothetical protein